MKRHIFSYATIALTLILLVLVVRKVGFEEILDELRHAEVGYIVIAIVIGRLAFMTSALKWHLLLKAQGYHVPLLHVVKLSFVGVFFNNFLPSNVGGDVVRSHEISQYINDRATGVASVFAERFIGLITLMILGSIAFLTHAFLIENVMLTGAMAIAAVGLLVLTWLALDARLTRFLQARIQWKIVQSLLAKFLKFQSVLQSYRSQPVVLAQSFVLSLGFYVGAILNIYLISLAFYEPVSLGGMAFVAPIAMIVSMMPVTVNGIGLMEWACVLLFPMIEVPASVALSAVLIIRAVTIASAILGGIFYMEIKSKRRAITVPQVQKEVWN